LKRLAPDICEMKRLFVTPQARASGLGRSLCLRLIEEAKGRGYREMKLDTLERLGAALTLYRGLGFAETTSYTPNPEPDVVYMSRPL
jgi:GNAT superfamily N-acetyltransferase